MERRPPDESQRTSTPAGQESLRERRERAEAERSRMRSAAGKDVETGRDAARAAEDTRQST